MTRAKVKKPVRKVVKRAKAAKPAPVAPPPIPHEQIADLLAQSRSEHRRYRHELATGTATVARAALQAASDLRHQADALDPLGLSPSWDEEGPFKAQHVALLTFYREKLT